MNKLPVEDVRKHMKALYGDFLEANRRITLEPARVPEALRPWIPYAELWGIDDDYDREKLVDTAPKSARDDLIAIVTAIEDDLDRWLAGESAKVDPPSDEYCAFTTLRMAADYAS